MQSSALFLKGIDLSAKSPNGRVGFDRRQWLILATVGLALAIVVIDTTVVIVTIPAIQQRFGATLRAVEWVTDLYALVFASLLLTAGKLADRYGRRRILISGICIFVVGSMMVGIAPSVGMILLGRAIQGVGASLMMPATLSILSSNFSGPSRGIAFGIWGGVSGGAIGAGPLLGGFLTTYASWRYAFLINVPIGITVIIMALRVIEEARDEEHQTALDIPGALLGGVGLGAIVFGAIEGQVYGWFHSRGTFHMGIFTWPFAKIPLSMVMFGIGIASIVGFGLFEAAMLRRRRDPLFDLSLLRFKTFRFGLLTACIVMFGQSGMIFVLSLFLQSARGFSAVATGLMIFPFAAAVFAAAPLAGQLSSRIGPKWVVTAGMICSTAADFWLSRIITVHTPAMQFVPPLLCYGVGVGLATAQLTNVIMMEIPVERSGAASGANSAVRRVGAAIGFAILGAMLAAGMAATGRAELSHNHTIPPAVRTSLNRALQQGLYASELNTGQIKKLPKAVQADIHKIVSRSMAAGARRAGLVAAILIFLGACSSLLVPNCQPRSDDERWEGPCERG
ncbi:MAG TPA: MFS transporter [Armatimonadota bacterium]|nr:MFS transporter [Armatimonadota bacterium]